MATVKEYLNEFYGNINNIDKKFRNYEYFQSGLKRYFFNIIVFLFPQSYTIYRRLYFVFFTILIIKLILLSIPIIIFRLMANEIVEIIGYDNYKILVSIFPYYIIIISFFISLFYSFIIDSVVYKKFDKIYSTLQNMPIDKQKTIFNDFGVRPNKLSKALARIIYIFTVYFIIRVILHSVGWNDDSIFIIGGILGILTVPFFIKFLEKYA